METKEKMSRVILTRTFSSYFVASPPEVVYGGQVAPPKHTQVKYIEEPEESHFSAGGIVAHAVIDEPIRIGHEQGERYCNLGAQVNCHFPK